MNRLDTAAWTRLYRVLAGLGLEQPTAPVRLFDAEGTATGDTLPLGWADLKVALHLRNDNVTPFKADDWTLIPLTPDDAQALATALRFIDDLMFAYQIRESEASAQQRVSRHERVLLEQLLRAGLPTPNRNLRIARADGTLLTIPDFAWEQRALAVFLDGHHWHGGQDLRKLITDAAKGKDASPRRKKAVEERWKSKAAADAEKRRQMTASGWTVIAVSDADIDLKDPGSLTPIVNDIAATWHRLPPQPETATDRHQVEN